MTYVNVLNSPNDYNQSLGIIERAKKFKNENPGLFLKAKALVFVNQPAPNYQSVNPSVQDIINQRAQSDSAPNPSLISKFVGLFKETKAPDLLSVTAGGSTSNKNRTKHKSNQKAKAKTQSKSKPKHKNNSKPKHRTKAKTIKKNKRAHHKFDKKYTRKR
jgi:hypothetical protein